MSPETSPAELDQLTQHLEEVQRLLSRRRLVENLVSRQEMPRHSLVEAVAHKEDQGKLARLLERLEPEEFRRLLERLDP